MITITHNATDITDEVNVEDFDLNAEENSSRDTLSFSIDKAPGGFAPELNAEVIVTRDGTKVFAGNIISLETEIEAPPTVRYQVDCVDYGYQLDRKLVTERFIDEEISDIISFIITNYAPTFTVENVVVSQTVNRISFNRLPVSECLDKLAKLNNFHWYVDYDKDIHFFARNQERAPFDITDTSSNYEFSSLRIRQDLAQLRNVIEVQGGKVPIAARTTLHAGDGETTEFPTNFEFDELPTVTVDGVEQTVGVEYLDETGFDCYWSNQQKYVRFDTGSIPPLPTPPDETNIEFTGNPLVPLVAIVPDEDSVDAFGEFEGTVIERSLRSQNQTIERAIAELESYAEAITDASFNTTTAGLRPGQVISIDSTLHGVTADYVVRSVRFRPYPNGAAVDGIWSVSLASTATMTLVEALRKLLNEEKLEDDERQVLLAFFRFSDAGEGADEVDPVTYSEGPYQWNSFQWNFGKWT